MSDFDNERINNLYQGLASKYEQRWACVEIESLRTELTEARRQLKEASEQEPFAWGFEDADVQLVNMSRAVLHEFAGESFPLFRADPVPQPAVPEAVAKARTMLRALAYEMYQAWDSDKDSRLGKMLHALCSESFAKEYRGDFAELHAILSATDSEVKK